MANIQLDISEPNLRMTIKVILSVKGHKIDANPIDLVITDKPDHAIDLAQHHTTLLLSPYSEIRTAVHAMTQGVWGYILLPLIPGELEIMIDRATHADSSTHLKKSTTLEEIEKQHIFHVLTACNYNRKKTAQILGIGRNTLWRKLKKYKLI